MPFLKSKIKFILPILIAVYMAVPMVSNAAFAGLVPCGGSTQAPCTVNDFLIGIARVTNFLISVAGIYAIYQIIFAGFNMVTSMGNDESIKQNKGQITNAVVGMVLVLLAYLFVGTVTNGILAQGDPCKKIDFANPLKYINNTQCK
jgi:hypothetical protein